MRRGFTLIEMMIALTIGAILVLAAAAFASHQMLAFSAGNQSLNMTQMGRRALDILKDDITNAGAGVGYFEDGRFAGLAVGNFTLPAGGGFNSDNQPIVLPTGAGVTDDVGIMLADSEYVTISDVINANAILTCAGSGFQANDVVVMRTEDGLSGKSVRVTGVVGPVACGTGLCAGNCEQIGFVDVPEFLSGPGATTADYRGGFVAGGFRRVTWFVTPGPEGGELRRAIGDCAARDATCGDVIADGVETVQMRVYTFTPPATGSPPGTPGTWTDQTNSGAGLTSFTPIRVDVEMVLRMRTPHDVRRYSPVNLVLETGACVPNCAAPDRFKRSVLKGSVFVRNAGRMRFEAPGS